MASENTEKQREAKELEMKTGIAYAFMDYEGRHGELVAALTTNAKKANFADNIVFTILNDKASTTDRYSGSRNIMPPKITMAAQSTEVYGSAPSDKIDNIPKIPKKASSLRYIVMLEYPEANDASNPGPASQRRANRVTAGRLDCVLSLVSEGEILAGRSMFGRAAVFYQDNRRNAQKY